MRSNCWFTVLTILSGRFNSDFWSFHLLTSLAKIQLIFKLRPFTPPLPPTFSNVLVSSRTHSPLRLSWDSALSLHHISVYWLERTGCGRLLLFATIGLFWLLASVAPCLGCMKQKGNSGTRHWCSLDLKSLISFYLSVLPLVLLHIKCLWSLIVLNG